MKKTYNFENFEKSVDWDKFNKIFRVKGLVHKFNREKGRFKKETGLSLKKVDKYTNEEFECLGRNKICIWANEKFERKIINNKNIKNIDFTSAYLECGLNNWLPLGKKENKQYRDNKHLNYWKITFVGDDEQIYKKYGICFNLGDIISDNGLQILKETSKLYEVKFLYSKELFDCSYYFDCLLYQKENYCKMYPKDKNIIKLGLLALIGCFGSKKKILENFNNPWISSFIWEKNLQNIWELQKEIIKNDKDAKILLIKTDCITFISKNTPKCAIKSTFEDIESIYFMNSSNYSYKRQNGTIKVVTNLLEKNDIERTKINVSNFQKFYFEKIEKLVVFE